MLSSFQIASGKRHCEVVQPNSRTTVLTRGPGTADIFVHMETLRRCGLIELRPGQTVLVRYGRGRDGLIAGGVRPENAVAAFSN